MGVYFNKYFDRLSSVAVGIHIMGLMYSQICLMVFHWNQQNIEPIQSNPNNGSPDNGSIHLLVQA